MKNTILHCVRTGRIRTSSGRLSGIGRSEIRAVIEDVLCFHNNTRRQIFQAIRQLLKDNQLGIIRDINHKNGKAYLFFGRNE
jgi:hypothetical protein